MMASHYLQKKVLNGDASHHYDLFCITTIGQVPPLPSITIHYLIINLGLSHYLKKKPIFATPSVELVFRLGTREDLHRAGHAVHLSMLQVLTWPCKTRGD